MEHFDAASRVDKDDHGGHEESSLSFYQCHPSGGCATSTEAIVTGAAYLCLAKSTSAAIGHEVECAIIEK